MLRRVGDRIQLSAALSNLGYSAMMAGDFATAAPLLDAAAAVDEEVQDARLLPFHLVNRGLLHAFEGEDRQAASDLARALVLCRESGQALPVSEGLTGLAAVTARRGDSKLAARLSGAADAHRLFEAVSVPERQLQEHVIASARASGAETYRQKEWTAGNSLTFDQALSLGLDAAAVVSRTA